MEIFRLILIPVIQFSTGLVVHDAFRTFKVHMLQRLLWGEDAW